MGTQSQSKAARRALKAGRLSAGREVARIDQLERSLATEREITKSLAAELDVETKAHLAACKALVAAEEKLRELQP